MLGFALAWASATLGCQPLPNQPCPAAVVGADVTVHIKDWRYLQPIECAERLGFVPGADVSASITGLDAASFCDRGKLELDDLAGWTFSSTDWPRDVQNEATLRGAMQATRSGCSGFLRFAVETASLPSPLAPPSLLRLEFAADEASDECPARCVTQFIVDVAVDEPALDAGAAFDE